MGVLFCYILSSTMGKPSRKSKKEPEEEVDSSSSEVESEEEEEEAVNVGSKRKFQSDESENLKKKAKGAAGETVTLFIGNLPWSASEEEIRDYFADYEFSGIRLMKDRDTQRFKGFCYIDFDSNIADTVLDLSGSDFNGRPIKIDRTKNSSAGDEEKSLTVYVGNLSYDTDEESVRNYFSECGSINTLRLISDRDGNPKGFGYIEFADQDGADAAITYHGQELDGRNIRVTYDSKKPDNNRGGRGGFGDRRGGRGGFGYRRGGRGGFGDRRGGRGGFGDRGGRGGRGGDRRGGRPNTSFQGKKITFD